MNYKCLKCETEFDATNRVICPSCGAHDWDCETLRKYKAKQVAPRVQEQGDGM